MLQDMYQVKTKTLYYSFSLARAQAHGGGQSLEAGQTLTGADLHSH